MRQLSQTSDCINEGDVKEVRLISNAEAEIWRERPGRFPQEPGKCGGLLRQQIYRWLQPHKTVSQDMARAERSSSSLNQQSSSQKILYQQSRLFSEFTSEQKAVNLRQTPSQNPILRYVE
jgi:hypothetical protein